MRIRILVAVILSSLLVEPTAAQVLPIPAGWQMERAILLSRHGVRSPMKTNEEMDRHVATPWPVWPVPPQKTLVPTRSRRPVPAHRRHRRCAFL